MSRIGVGDKAWPENLTSLEQIEAAGWRQWNDESAPPLDPIIGTGRYAVHRNGLYLQNYNTGTCLVECCPDDALFTHQEMDARRTSAWILMDFDLCPFWLAGVSTVGIDFCGITKFKYHSDLSLGFIYAAGFPQLCKADATVLYGFAPDDITSVTNNRILAHYERISDDIKRCTAWFFDRNAGAVASVSFDHNDPGSGNLAPIFAIGWTIDGPLIRRKGLLRINELRTSTQPLSYGSYPLGSI